MLTVGDTFPAFALKAVQGGPAGLNLDTAFIDITSSSDPGKWKLVFFWPKDFTFVCPTEIVAFGKMANDFADRDTVVYGVSTDSEFVHMNWRLHHADLRTLPIPMLSCSPFQAAGTEIPCFSFKLFSMTASEQGRRHDHETTVDHALMRGLVTAGP
jgi:alkyl hydroperoxide reductase subunit AhpC